MKIGHAHLKVRDLERAISFYEKFLGLEVVERVGDSYAFLTSGEMHHEIALQNAGPDAPAPHPSDRCCVIIPVDPTHIATQDPSPGSITAPEDEPSPHGGIVAAPESGPGIPSLVRA